MRQLFGTDFPFRELVSAVGLGVGGLSSREMRHQSNLSDTTAFGAKLASTLIFSRLVRRGQFSVGTATLVDIVVIFGGTGMNDVTQILSRIDSGDVAAAEQLLPLVYDELRALAARELRRERPGQTLQATGLVHEAYIRLVDGNQPHPWNGRRHFFAAAAQAMRRILVDRARQKLSLKGGGRKGRRDLEADKFAEIAAPAEVIAVHDALDALAAEDELAAELVKLRYFAAFSIEEAAEILQLSRATAYRLWTYARAWLRASLDKQGPEE
jgi:RNA polymerase sigma factor (TIGR02999 family)